MLFVFRHVQMVQLFRLRSICLVS
jgi:hypothetical protein